MPDIEWGSWAFTTCTSCTGNDLDYWTDNATVTTSATVTLGWTDLMRAVAAAAPNPALRPPSMGDVERALAAQNEARRAADARAEALLRSVLSPEQRAMLERFDYFHVRGSRGGAYRIHRGRTRNIRQCDGAGQVWRPLAALCVHPEEEVPDADTMAAQKLWLEADEPAVLARANRGPLYAGEAA